MAGEKKQKLPSSCPPPRGGPPPTSRLVAPWHQCPLATWRASQMHAFFRRASFPLLPWSAIALPFGAAQVRAAFKDRLAKCLASIVGHLKRDANHGGDVDNIFRAFQVQLDELCTTLPDCKVLGLEGLASEERKGAHDDWCTRMTDDVTALRSTLIDVCSLPTQEPWLCLHLGPRLSPRRLEVWMEGVW